MEVGIIAPPSMVELIKDIPIKYTIPEVINSNEAYKTFLLESSKNSDLIIVDLVKPGWKREPEELDECKKALEGLENFCLTILPSYMYKVEKTVRTALDYMEELGIKSPVGCIEGTTIEEVLECYKRLQEGGVHTIAVPNHIYPFFKGNGIPGELVFIDNRSSLKELVGCRGILVTSLPIRLGLKGRFLSDYSPSPPKLDFTEAIQYKDIIEINIREALAYYEQLQ